MFKEFVMDVEDTVLAEQTINPYLRIHCRFINYMAEKFPFHDHDFYEIFLIAKGQIKHFINGKMDILDEGALVFIRPQDCHRYYDIQNKDCTYVNFKFYKDLFDSLITFLSLEDLKVNLLTSETPPTVYLSLYEKDKLIKKFNKINYIPADNLELQKINLRSLLTELIIDFINTKREALSQELPEWFVTLCSKIKKDGQFVESITSLAEISGKSPEHISRCFKKYLNTTPTGYITDIKLNYAANLLSNTDMKIIDICMECGFFSLSHFYKIFKNKYGISVSQYRNENYYEK